MTVAAIILAGSSESPLAEVDGLPRVRRLADVAWSGGALPIVVVARDPDNAVAAALAGAPVVLAEAAPGGGPAAEMARGMDVAVAHVRETDGAMLWPARMAWIGPETVTSLIEAHGLDRAVLIRPAYRGELGWPVLVPISAVELLHRVGADAPPDRVVEAILATGLSELALELGDPGSVLDASIERSAMPAYEGPLVPAGGVNREWGASVADEPEDAPLAGPSLAPYPPAADEGDA
jgi:CTP:molybdopterin cytidylyltransferase MocA